MEKRVFRYSISAQTCFPAQSKKLDIQTKMTLESTVICVDNSEYCRNGDYAPTRLLAQRDAINMVTR